jgi:hypothetical protein
MYEVKAYRCSHCSKLHGQKGNCKRHEVKCFHNPETKSCASCEHHHFDWTENHCMVGLITEGRVKTQCTGYTEREY